MPGDSDWDSTIPRDVNIIKQHTWIGASSYQEQTRQDIFILMEGLCDQLGINKRVRKNTKKKMGH